MTAENRSKMNRQPGAGWLLAALLLAALLAVGMAACAAPAPAPAATATPPPLTPSPSLPRPPSPTPLPLAAYTAPHGGFSLQAPQGWPAEPIAGGMRFQAPQALADDFGQLSRAVITAYFQPLPADIDPETYLSSVISQTISALQLNDSAAFALDSDFITEEGARHLEMIGRFDPAQPPARLLAEMWVAQGVMVGISLHGPTADWVQIQPLWPLLRQGFVLGDVARARDAAGPDYFHPSGQFALTLPAGWDIAEEMADGALLTEMGHLAQFQITFQEMDHRPTARDLEAAVFGALGDLPEQEGFIELAREEVSAYARLARFESVTAEEGIYRTELQAFANGNHLFSTSFSAPPHFWDTFAPAYELLMASLQLPAPAPPDEATQDADPIAGVMVGPTLFYRARGGSLWVSAPIHNYRTRNLEDLTAAVQLFDAADKLIVAESWRLQQRVLPAGATTYLTMRLTPEDYPLDEASYALVKVVDATDTQQPALAPWGYMGGAAEVNAQGDVAMRLTMRNASNETRNRIYLTALLYDAAGNLSFARAETMNLRRNVGPGERVELEMIIWGPFGGVFGFGAVGEVPQ